jgi:hypothetical protein
MIYLEISLFTMMEGVQIGRFGLNNHNCQDVLHVSPRRGREGK